MKSRLRLILCVTAISLGGAVIGIDAGIIATVIAQTSFTDYMFPPGTKNASSLLGAIVSMGSAGSAVGSLMVGFLLEKVGRKYTIAISTFFTIVGSLFQTVANGVPLMIVGRLVAGIALGILTPAIPVYVSELARPAERARLIGIFGLILSIGFCIANWIGYACSFSEGSFVWRLELAMQFPLAVVLLILCIFLPESPRWRKSPNLQVYTASMISNNASSCSKGSYRQVRKNSTHHLFRRRRIIYPIHAGRDSGTTSP